MYETKTQPGIPEHVEDDVPCNQCGYNLRTQSIDGDCPECGQPVEHSIGLGAIKRWPLNAEWPCNWMCIGLFMTMLFGVGLIIWTAGLIVFLIRMRPNSMGWALVRHTTWLSLLAVLGSVFVTLLTDTYYYATISGLLLFFTCATIVHFTCIFLVAIRITSDAQMPKARNVAIVCLTAQILVAIYAVLSVPQSYATASLGVVMCSVVWAIIGGIFWMGVAVTLGDTRESLIRQANRKERAQQKQGVSEQTTPAA